MDQSKVVELLGQASGAEVGEVFREFLRSHVRLMITEVMAAEVTELCGAKYGPRAGSEYQRAGSAEGKVLLEGRGETVKRPRVRKRVANGSTKEVSLETYGAAQDPAQLQESIVRALVAGVSGREMQEVHPESPRVSKSSVSRLWKKAGTRFVDELRSRDIASPEWVALLLDGIVLSKAQTAIVALGVMRDGTKQILDFDLGSSENFEVCRDLLDRLVARGFAVSHRLFSVLDGSQSLKKALLAFFPDAVIQRCLIHKERNLKAKLSRRDWGELSRLFKRLREVQGESAAREVLGELEQFLERKNAAALASLREAGDELIALHLLEVPSTLQVSLLSTNVIENSFRNTRRKLGRVTRFRPETDQASRWLAYALLEAEKGFRRIAGWRDLGHLVKALERPAKVAEGIAESPAATSPPFRPAACTPAPSRPMNV